MMKQTTVEAKRNAPVTAPLLFVTAVFWVGMSASPAFGDIIYSGPQNILLQGMPNSSQVFNIFIAGDPAPWDTLAFEINTEAQGLGVNNIIPGISEVALATSSSDFPFVTRFQYGDSFPSDPIFGSGSEVLWVGTSPADGDFYAAMESEAFDKGPDYQGWVHLEVSNTATSSPLIIVKGWAYALGETISSIGQGSPAPGSSGGGTSVPEIDPASGVGALTLLSGTLLVVRGRRQREPGT